MLLIHLLKPHLPLKANLRILNITPKLYLLLLSQCRHLSEHPTHIPTTALDLPPHHLHSHHHVQIPVVVVGELQVVHRSELEGVAAVHVDVLVEGEDVAGGRCEADFEVQGGALGGAVGLDVSVALVAEDFYLEEDAAVVVGGVVEVEDQVERLGVV